MKTPNCVLTLREDCEILAIGGDEVNAVGVTIRLGRGPTGHSNACARLRRPVKPRAFLGTGEFAIQGNTFGLARRCCELP
jgi:hypothetical protein